MTALSQDGGLAFTPIAEVPRREASSATNVELRIGRIHRARGGLGSDQPNSAGVYRDDLVRAGDGWQLARREIEIQLREEY